MGFETLRLPCDIADDDAELCRERHGRLSLRHRRYLRTLVGNCGALSSDQGWKYSPRPVDGVGWSCTTYCRYSRLRKVEAKSPRNAFAPRRFRSYPTMKICRR